MYLDSFRSKVIGHGQVITPNYIGSRNKCLYWSISHWNLFRLLNNVGIEYLRDIHNVSIMINVLSLYSGIML